MSSPVVLYRFCTTRNKLKSKGKSAGTLKNNLFQENPYCYKCGGSFPKRGFELEHKVPVMLGGHIFDRSNIGLVCRSCHRHKTGIDKRVIKIFEWVDSNREEVLSSGC